MTLQIYLGLILLICLQRFFELWLSKKHEKSIIKSGGFEVGHNHYPYMVLVQSLWLVACAIEALSLKEIPGLFIIIFFTLLFLVGQFFRLLAILTLKERWTVKIMILPTAPVLTKGIYSKIRHPNYLGMIIEIFSLPLILGLWKTALLLSIMNGIILYIRIKCEEEALEKHLNYKSAFESKGRIIP